MGSDCGIANVNVGTSGLKLVEPLVVKKRPVAVESLVRILGKPTCDGKRRRSITLLSYH